MTSAGEGEVKIFRLGPHNYWRFFASMRGYLKRRRFRFAMRVPCGTSGAAGNAASERIPDIAARIFFITKSYVPSRKAASGVSAME